jgi:hypothetical protein
VKDAADSLRSMSEDTQDIGVSSYNKAIPAILQMAHERKLHKKGSPVYLRLKEEPKELELIR